MNKQTTKYKQAEIGEIPEDWVSMPFGEVAYLSKEIFDPKKAGQNKGTVYLGLEHFCEGGFALNGVGQSDEIQSNKFRFVSGDVLFGKLRPYFKKVYSPKFDGVCSTDIWVLRAKQGVGQKFLYFLVGSDTFLNKAVESSEGTKMPRASWDFIANYKFPIPSIGEQQQITNFLSSLDDKIELNRKMNKTLEEIGKALFKRWFVDFEFSNDDGKPYKSGGGEMVDSELRKIPEGWEVGEIGSVVNIVYGKGLLTNKLKDNGYPVFGGNGIIGFFDKYLYEEPQVIVGCRGAGSGNIKQTLPKSYVTNNSLVLEIPCDSKIDRFYLGQHLSLTGVDEYITGSAQPQITVDSLKKYLLLIPSTSILKIFNGQMKIIDLIVSNNEREIESLSQIRDSLLPRLMSGKLRVN